MRATAKMPNGTLSSLLLGFSTFLLLDIKANLTPAFKRVDKQMVNETETSIADEIIAATPTLV